MIIDIFTYTNATPDASFSIDALIDAARRAHLDGIAVTDRASASNVRAYQAAAKNANFFVAYGVELETTSGRVTAYPSAIDDEFVSESWKSLGDKPDAEAVLEYFHARGGIVIARDIYNRGEGLKDRVYSIKDEKGRGFDAIDTVSAYRRRIDNELSIEAQQVMGAPACAGSGVFDELNDIGHCATLFASDINDQASFVAAMRAPLHWACSLKDLGTACPMGSAPKPEGDDRHFDRRDSERRPMHGRGDAKRGQRGDDRRRGRRDDDRRGERRCSDDRRDDRRGGDYRRNSRGDSRRSGDNRQRRH